MQLDHVALAVRSIEAVRDRLCRITGYSVATDKVTNTRQQVNVQFLSKPGSLDIKLIEPSGPDAPLVDFVKRGAGLHHLAFKVSDVGEACSDLAGRGARILVPPQPGEAFEDHLIAFVFLGGVLNAELLDTEERRSRRSDPAEHSPDDPSGSGSGLESQGR